MESVHLVADVMRLACVVLAFFGVGLMTSTLLVAHQVLRPAQRLGFFWWHIFTISVAVAGSMFLMTEAVVGRLGQPVTWRLPVTVAVLVLLDLALVVVFRVERSRLVAKRAGLAQ